MIDYDESDKMIKISRKMDKSNKNFSISDISFFYFKDAEDDFLYG